MPVEIAYFHSSELNPFKFTPIWELKLTNFSLGCKFMNLVNQVKGRVYLKNLRFLKISFFDLMNALPLVLGWEKGFSLIWAFSAV